MAAAFAVTVPGRALVQGIRPLENIDKIKLRIDLVSECRRLLSEGRSPGIEHFEDLTLLFKKIRPPDAVLAPFELMAFMPLFYSALNLKILSHDPSYSALGVILSRLTTNHDLKKSIEASIDREGGIRDEASPELSYIRRSIKSSEEKIKKILEDTLNRKDLLPHIQDYYLTERNKRWVIPVKRDSKGIVPGIVHDISNTGETVFVEPYSIQNPGNELESYRAEEKLEEYRVLRRLSALLREHIREIEEDYRIVARADSIQAIAGFSEQMAMSPSEINEKGHMKIINGRHPFLWKTLRKENREGDLVPLDLEIGKGHSCIVITGSNAGGKTVSLKTVGVLNLMALSGMHIPAGAGTTIPFLERVLVDIGDEQSIEQNLSTFSAHITRITEIIRQSSTQTLIIIDELGTGTDPEQGGALSCAILKRLMQRGALSVVSTHIGMLKAFAHSEPGMTNSAMEMEEITAGGVSSYRPTYKFIIGEPGTSHTFEIAESLGLDADLIKEAREFINGESTAVESLISELKQKTGELENRLKETEELKQDVINLRSSLNEEVSMIRSSKKETLSEALREAEDIIKSAGRYARDIIEKLKKAKLSESKEMIKDIDRRHEDMKKTRREIVPAKIQKLKEVKAGQHVFIKTLETNGVVHSVNERTRKCKVLVSGKEITISINDLYEPIAEIIGQRSDEHVISGRSELQYAPSSGDIEIPDELNVIGLRVDPAVSGIERYLNDASLANVGQVKIIHGIGTGRLSRAIRDYLKDHPLVESLRKGNEDEGGEAVTIVYL